MRNTQQSYVFLSFSCKAKVVLATVNLMIDLPLNIRLCSLRTFTKRVIVILISFLVFTRSCIPKPAFAQYQPSRCPVRRSHLDQNPRICKFRPSRYNDSASAAPHFELKDSLSLTSRYHRTNLLKLQCLSLRTLLPPITHGRYMMTSQLKLLSNSIRPTGLIKPLLRASRDHGCSASSQLLPLRMAEAF